MKSLIKYSLSLLLTWCGFCAFAVLAADGKPDPLTRASIFIDAGRLKDAVALLKTHEPADPKEAQQVTLLMGKIYLAIDRPAKALELFQSVDEQLPFNWDVVMGAAQASLKLGRFVDARKYATNAAKIDMASAEPELLLALIEQRTGQTADANARMENLLRKRPGSESHVLAYARYLVSAGEQTKAMKTLQVFREAHPKAAQVLDQLGELEFNFGSKPAALDLKREAAKSYANQGDEYRVRVIQSWVEDNIVARAAPQRDTEMSKPIFPSEPSPESAPKVEAGPQASAPPNSSPNVQPDVQPNLPPKAAEKKEPPTPVEQKPKLAKFTDPDVNLPVQRFPFPRGVTITGGSGFIVDEGRKIVTNKHVIEGGKEFAIRTGLGEVIRAKVVFISQTDDLAILELHKPLPADRAIPAAAYAKPRVGRDVVVMGYPLWYILGEGSPSLTNGVVSKGTGMGDDRHTFQLTAKVNKGNSGGPVFDLNGNVVGITVGKLDSQKINQEQGFVPEDINFAIHVDRLPPMAKVSLKAEGLSEKPVSPETLYQLMLGRVVMVATYK
jgi:S1-C subfamily serine protease/Flp pilus assembly protein TadD